MKRAIITAIAVLLASTLVFAQAPAATPQSQPPATGKPAAPAAGQAAAPAGKRQPMAKTQEEFNDYKQIADQQDGALAEKSAAEFVLKYPESELRAGVYQMLMSRYQQANNGDKTLEMARKSLQYDPDNAIPLVMLATVLAERVRNTDLGKGAKGAE